MSSTRKALGDFQTPLDLARGVVERLRARAPFTTVLEPTCGKGAFLQAAAEGAVGVQRLLGLEIQAVHLAEAATRLTGAPVELREGDLFTVDLAEWVGERPGELLVVGNPPWVTAAELGAMGIPRPTCSKPTGLGGLESLTGRSNFDLAEAVWLKLIEELTYARPTIALLCKQSVARRVLGWCRQCEVPMAGAQFIPINGKRWFGIAAECGLFVIDVAGEVGPYSYDVFEGLTDRVAVRTVGFRGDQLVPDLARFESVAAFGGQCPAVWRQGLKHDAADVMELEVHGAGWTDRAGRPIDLDPHTVYPLAKGGDVYHGRVLSKAVVVPQKSLGLDTTHLRETAPRTWAYLNGCRARLDRRRSRIYQGRLKALLARLDSETRTVPAIIVLDDSERRLRSGQLARLKLQRTVPMKGYWLPITALIGGRRGLWNAYVLEPAGQDAGKDLMRAGRREVQILHSESERAFVRGTVRDGERVVSSGLHRLVPNQLVRAE